MNHHSKHINHASQYYEEAEIQCVAWQMEIPGLSNNTTGNLKQNEIIIGAPVDQAIDQEIFKCSTHAEHEN